MGGPAAEQGRAGRGAGQLARRSTDLAARGRHTVADPAGFTRQIVDAEPRRRRGRGRRGRVGGGDGRFLRTKCFVLDM